MRQISNLGDKDDDKKDDDEGDRRFGECAPNECERTPIGNSARIAACHPPPPSQLSRFFTKIVFCLCVFQFSPIPFHRPTRLCCSDCKLLREVDLYNQVVIISEEHKSGVTWYFWAGWRLFSAYLQVAWSYLVFHQSSSKKMINTKFFSHIQSQKYHVVSDHQSSEVHFSQKIGQNKNPLSE